MHGNAHGTRPPCTTNLHEVHERGDGDAGVLQPGGVTLAGGPVAEVEDATHDPHRPQQQRQDDAARHQHPPELGGGVEPEHRLPRDRRVHSGSLELRPVLLALLGYRRVHDV